MDVLLMEKKHFEQHKKLMKKLKEVLDDFKVTYAMMRFMLRELIQLL